MSKPDYCVYQAVKPCSECSLSNYGRDCRNNPISIPPKTREKMDYITTQIRLTPAQYEALRQLVFDTRVSIAEHLRRALDLYLKNLNK